MLGGKILDQVLYRKLENGYIQTAHLLQIY